MFNALSKIFVLLLLSLFVVVVPPVVVLLLSFIERFVVVIAFCSLIKARVRCYPSPARNSSGKTS